MMIIIGVAIGVFVFLNLVYFKAEARRRLWESRVVDLLISHGDALKIIVDKNPGKVCPHSFNNIFIKPPNN